MAFFLPPEEPVKLYETGFDDDLLGRKRVSISLSEILERIEDPLVIALDGRWGTGKSYFLKRWVGAHRIENGGRGLTLYFDAFARDYLSDPLIALVGALSNLPHAPEKSRLDKVKSAAVKLIKPTTRFALAMASFGATEALSDVGDAAVDAFKNEADKALDDFWKREEGREAAMTQFRSAIEALMKGDGQDEVTPLIIVIDELDRCRPDYALELLEVIKHFFAVPHVHFVLGVNLKALENSVKARYGAEIDATAYLQKFLSFTLNLPDHIGDKDRTSSIIKYLDYLGDRMKTPRYLLAEIRIQLKVLSRRNHISVRDVGKILSTTAILPEEAQKDNILVGYRAVMVTLLIMKIINIEIFPKFLDASLNSDELEFYLGADEKYTRRTLVDGEYNPSFDRDTLYRLAVWKHVCDGGIKEEASNFPLVGEFFHVTGIPDDLRGVPKFVHEKWISLINV